MFLLFANKVIAIFTILLALGSLVVLLGILLKKRDNSLMRFVSKYRTELGLFVAGGSVLGSLYYSEIVGYEPCTLCWWARIFIYSSALIMLVAILKKKADAFVYVLPLSIIGILFAINHLIITWFPGKGFSCDAVELCTKLYVNEFGFVSIPLMVFVVYVALIVLSFTGKKEVPQS